MCIGKDVLDKLDEVIVSLAGLQPIDYTTMFNDMISNLGNIEGNTDEIETILNNINSDTSATTTNTAQTVSELENVATLLQELDDNTDQVEAILAAILASLSSPDAALAQGIPMPAICASIDGGDPTYVTPIVLLNQSTGEIVGKNYVDPTGNPITGQVSELDSCDCKDCTSCTEDNSTTDVSFLLDNVATIGYDADYTSGIRIEFFTDLDSGYDVEPKQYLLDLPADPTGTEDTHQIIVTQGNIVDINGVQQSLPFSIPFHNNGNGNNSSSEAVFNFSSNFIIDTGIPWEPSTILEYTITDYP